MSTPTLDPRRRPPAAAAAPVAPAAPAIEVNSVPLPAPVEAPPAIVLPLVPEQPARPRTAFCVVCASNQVRAAPSPTHVGRFALIPSLLDRTARWRGTTYSRELFMRARLAFLVLTAHTGRLASASSRMARAPPSACLVLRSTSRTYIHLVRRTTTSTKSWRNKTRDCRYHV